MSTREAKANYKAYINHNSSHETLLIAQFPHKKKTETHIKVRYELQRR